MIRITKPAPPSVLTTRGTDQTSQDCLQYDLYPDEYKLGKRKFSAIRAIYAHTEVKEALIKAQYKKCAFCESFVRHTGYGDVEHFRPKGGYQQQEGDALTYPGYYWLTYDWNNLFFCCQICNQQFKQNLFPLVKPDTRANCHNDRDKVALEEPLLIDPAGKIDPETLVGFHAEESYSIGDNPYGCETIKILGLNRPDLREARSRVLWYLKPLCKNLEMLRAVLQFDETNADLRQAIEEQEQLLRRASEMHKEYSSAVRCALEARFPGYEWR